MEIKSLDKEYVNLKCIPAVYIFTNISNGKRYIGETLNLKRRMVEYMFLDRGTDRIVQKAIYKYGISNFSFEFYYFPDFNKKDLVKLEEHMIKTYNSITPNGYNLCPYGTSGVNVKEVHKYDPLNGEYLNTYKSVENASKHVNGSASNISMVANCSRKTAHGFIWSYIKQDRVTPVKFIGITKPKNIIQYSKNGKLINTFSSLRDAANSVGGTHNNICNVCNGKSKTAYGFIWSYN